MSPTTEGGGWGEQIGFDVDPVSVGIAKYLYSYLLNQWVDFEQTCIDTLLRVCLLFFLGGGGGDGRI